MGSNRCPRGRELVAACHRVGRDPLGRSRLWPSSRPGPPAELGGAVPGPAEWLQFAAENAAGSALGGARLAGELVGAHHPPGTRRAPEYAPGGLRVAVDCPTLATGPGRGRPP